ncbi:zinc-dependent metalloprotease [Aquimarina sp. ERC-38]|uniref:zinc-dependent metalloprotease n=1 Tax=Aquimarina sp. ERC-38 TaxID=2949996 RepID=UPI0022479526|nr:zinc-dependent metalloprotease [Aquimarina sp. ERC-38]UZO80928.1 zinc-dependent metalloprotease [Aquimarina sp. ERC-38]
MKNSSSKLIKLLLLLLVLLISGGGTLHAQKKKKKKKDKTEQSTEKKKEKNKIKSIKEATKQTKKVAGLFTIYRDTLDGSTFMQIDKSHLGKEYIYFSQIADGVLDAGIFRGAFMDNKVFKVKKHYNKIEFITQNTSYYFDPENALSKSAQANISEGIMASLKIEAQDTINESYLIKADDLFLKETFEQIKPPKYPNSKPTDFSLGSLDKEKTKIEKINNYPENTNVESHYTYSQSSVLNNGSQAVTDGRNVTIKVTHSLIALPENNYEIRLDDPRVGYFFSQVTDMTATNATPYRDLIHRWNLVKKNPNATISEPEKPIVWWIENSTPIEFRETIKEAVLEWNKAFLQAGFKDAIVVKTQPDDATWDAGDIRYNVLRWTSSPQPPFGGYGPSFVNPKTGEILGADIMLEYVYHKNIVRYENLLTFNPEARQQIALHPTLKKNKSFLCSFGHEMQSNILFGQSVLLANGNTDNEMKGMKLEAMKELVMHEVGHTLGLNHNMKASQLFTPEELNSPEKIKGKCLTGSVMDYTAINVTLDKSKQGAYFSTSVGPYDKWAIRYGYTPVTSQKDLDAITSESTRPEHIFGNDADDMRSPGKAIDPRVMTSDMSNDQITYSIERMKLVNNMISKLTTKFNKEGNSYQELRQAFYVLRSQYGRAGDVISRFIGGVYVDRSMIGQDKNLKPYTPVSYKDQKRAMNALSTYVFSPAAYKTPEGLYDHLALQRRGFNFFSDTEDPKIHDLILAYQNRVLNHIMHPKTLQRITDSELYGNQYQLSEFMTDLNTAIFQKDSKGSINSFRQNLQRSYTDKLLAMVDNENSKNNYSFAAQSMALQNLIRIKSLMNNTSGDAISKAHKNYLKIRIQNVLEDI